MNKKAPTTKSYPFKMSVVPQLRNPGLNATFLNNLYMTSFYLGSHLHYLLYMQRNWGSMRRETHRDRTACEWWSPGYNLILSNPTAHRGGRVVKKAFHTQKWLVTPGASGPLPTQSDGSARFAEWMIGHSCGQASWQPQKHKAVGSWRCSCVRPGWPPGRMPEA